MIYFMGGALAQNNYLKTSGIKDGYFLETFYSLRNGDINEKMNKIFSIASKLIVDSGAFTFMNAKKDGCNVFEMDMYFRDYCNFIKKYKDDDRIVGFFELDIDRVLGVDKALYYLEELTKITDKIIPVWHNTRPVSFYHEMCRKYKRVAISQAMKIDVDEAQLNYFINTAHHYGAKIHLLGFTRFRALSELNLHKGDSFDSVSYIMTSAFGKIRLLNNKFDTFEWTFE